MSLSGLNLEVCTALFYDKHRELHGLPGLCSGTRVVRCLLQHNNTGITGLGLLERELERKNETAGLFAEFYGSVTQWIKEMDEVRLVSLRQFHNLLLARLPLFN